MWSSATDLGLPTPASGDLSPWCEQGVMLLNRVLTVRPGASASHQGKGWETVTAHPSPLSARAGFFGSRPFSRSNALLVEQGAVPVDWTLPSRRTG